MRTRGVRIGQCLSNVHVLPIVPAVVDPVRVWEGHMAVDDPVNRAYAIPSKRLATSSIFQGRTVLLPYSLVGVTAVPQK